jgi:ubiquinone/menaquinone biosynthesis C-methylase UbiE
MSDEGIRAVHRRGREQYAGVAERYATSESHARGDDLAWFGERAAAIRPTLALDVACGGGFSTRALAGAGHRVVATDLTPEAAAAARAATSPDLPVTWAAAAAEQLPFRDASFAVVGCRIAPHHFGDVGRFVLESARVLGPGGTLLVVDTTVPEDPDAARWIDDVERLRDPSHVRALPESAWTELVDRAGLRLEETTTVRKGHPLEAWLSRSGCEGDAAEEVRRRMREAPASIVSHWSVELDEAGDPVAFTDSKLCLRAVRPARR